MAHINPTMMDYLTSRQEDGTLTQCPSGFVNVNGRCVYWWYTRTGVIVKWSLFFGFILIFSAYMIGGYMHAKRRIRKGLPPLAYHRWLLPRSDLARSDPRYAYPQASFNNYQPQNGYYGMNYMPPPPVYDPNSTRPPMYDSNGAPMPDGGSKVDPSQQRPQNGSGSDYAAPPGPPPAAAQRPNNTGNNPFLG